MLRINQIKVPVDYNGDISTVLRKKAAVKLGIPVSEIISLSIFKRSIDARREICYVYAVDVEIGSNRKYKKSNDVIIVNPLRYSFPYKAKDSLNRPVIIGMGPAGLFCGLMLSKAGYRPLLLERGKKIEDRTEDVRNFWENGKLITDSNVQFGEGGAGAFSDGKLNTVVKDKSGKNRMVLETFVEHGAHEDILFDNKPHVGTDVLVEVVKSIRNEILKFGGEIRYNTTVKDFVIKDNQICGVVANDEVIECTDVILATGHSSRDTFEVLNAKHVPMEPKAFAVGFRVSHPQRIINKALYGQDYDKYNLPAAPYKLTYNAEDGRGVYSFCMCPGGYVVNASSEAGMTAVNGMSYHKRDSGTANSAIVVTVNPVDFPGEGSLKGMHYQRSLEKKAYELAGGRIPVQRYGDFKKELGINSGYKCTFEESLSFKGNIELSNLTKLFDEDINRDIVSGMEHFGKIIKGFNDDNCILAGVESRTSSPVRILRDVNGESQIGGLYPCGEGAGYAGGITSAAIDGIYIAECVANKINKSGK